MIKKDSVSTDDDDSAILAAYHQSLLGDNESDTDIGRDHDSTDLQGDLRCLQMMERNRQLSLQEANTPGNDVVADSTDRADDYFDKEHELRIGRFQIIRKVGHGGNGVVLLAVDPKLDREVALKVPNPDALLDPEYIRRFEREAKIAAGLRHPHIVSVYETGSIGPVSYIASAYCNGPTLSQWLLNHGGTASSTAAARLILALTQAIQYAHSKGVLHRDIKPSNILLENVTASPLTEDQLHAAARLADFGLAKHVDDNVTMTRDSSILGTPAYMAPEQADGKINEIDTRSDIFSIGCVLHELLTGVAPFRRDSALATLQALRTEQPSTQRLAGAPRDLQAITLKCLEKRPEHRYQTADALANDLSSFLSGRPVSARNITTVERAGRWGKQNPVLASMGALVTVLTILIAIGSSIAAVQLARSQKRLEQEAQNKADVSSFLSTEILGQASPFANPNRQLTLVEALENAARRLEGHFVDQPLVEAEIRLTLGRTYSQLAKNEQADLHLSRAYELRSRELGNDHPQTLKVAFEQVLLKFNFVDANRARDAWIAIAKKQRVNPGEFHRDTLRTQNYLAYSHAVLGEFEDAEALFEKTIASYLLEPGEDDPDTLDCLDSKARMLRFQEKYAESEELHTRIVATRERVLGVWHPQYQDSLSALAKIKMLRGNNDEAASLFDNVVQLQRQTLGDDHPDTLVSTGNAATALFNLNDYDSAEQLYVATLAMERDRFGVDDERINSTLRGLASLYRTRGRYKEAATLLEEALESRRRVHGDHKFTVNALNSLAMIYVYLGRHADAEKHYREVIEIQLRLHGSDSQQVLDATQQLAYGFRQAGRLNQAEDLATKLLKQQTRLNGREHSNTLASIIGLAYAKMSLKKYAEAEPLFQEAWKLAPELIGPTSRETLKLGNRLGEVLLHLGRMEEAEGLIQSVLDTRTEVYPDHRDIDSSLRRVVLLRTAQGNPKAVAQAEEERFRLRLKLFGPMHGSTFSVVNDWNKAIIALENAGENKPAQSSRKRLHDHLAKVSEDLFSKFAEHPERAARAIHSIAYQLRLARFTDLAEEIVQRILEQQENRFGRKDKETLRSVMELAFLYKVQRRDTESENLFREVWTQAPTVWGPDARDTLRCGYNLTSVLRFQGRHEEAGKLLQRVLGRQTATLGEFHEDTADSIHDLAYIQKRLGNLAEAVELYERLAIVGAHREGSSSPTVESARKNLFQIATAYEGQGDWMPAIATRDRLVDLNRDLLGEYNKETADSIGALARTYGLAGQWQVSHDVHTKELDIRRQPGIKSPRPLYVEYLLANDLSHLQRDTEAIELLRRNIKNWEALDPTNPKKFFSYELIGSLLISGNDFDEAEATLLAAYDTLNAMKDDAKRSMHRRHVLERIVSLYEASSKPALVERWTTILESVEKK